MSEATQTRILHARSGVTLEQQGDQFAVASLRLEQTMRFDSQDEALRAFDAEVGAAEKDPELMSGLAEPSRAAVIHAGRRSPIPIPRESSPGFQNPLAAEKGGAYRAASLGDGPAFGPWGLWFLGFLGSGVLRNVLLFGVGLIRFRASIESPVW